MFEVFSNRANVHGVLVYSNKNQLVYSHDKTVLENGKVETIKPGLSYELVSNDEPQQLNFETSPGAADGVDTISILGVLVHREESLLSQEYSEAKALVIRSLKMAMDALQSELVAA